MLQLIQRSILLLPLACLFLNISQASATPKPSSFTIPAKQRIVIYVADG